MQEQNTHSKNTFLKVYFVSSLQHTLNMQVCSKMYWIFSSWISVQFSEFPVTSSSTAVTSNSSSTELQNNLRIVFHLLESSFWWRFSSSSPTPFTIAELQRNCGGIARLLHKSCLETDPLIHQSWNSNSSPFTFHSQPEHLFRVEKGIEFLTQPFMDEVNLKHQEFEMNISNLKRSVLFGNSPYIFIILEGPRG